MKHELPEGWKEYSIREIGTVITGNTPPKKDPENYDGTLPWIKPPDLDIDMYVSSSNETISDIGRKKVRLLPKGSVLISCIGNIGKIAIAESELCTNQQINSIVPDKNIVDSVFLYYTIKRIRPYLESIASSAVLPLLNKTDFSNIKIKLPPLETQHKIVSILEKAEETKKLRAQADKLIQQLIQSVFLETFGNPRINPKKWKWTTFENILLDKTSLSYGILKPGDYDENGVPMLRVLDIGNGKLNNTKLFKVGTGLADQYRRTYLESGDIVLAIMATIGRCMVIPHNLTGANVNRALAVIKLNKSIANSDYIYQLIQSNYFQEIFIKNKIGSSQKRINLSDLRKFELPLPPLHYQEKFSNFAKTMDSLCNYQEASSQEIETLFNALMQKAFNGELVS